MPVFEIRHDPMTRTLTFTGSFDEDELARIRLSEEDHFKIFRAERPDALIPLPLHRKRLRSRGFDQTLELATPLATSTYTRLLSL